MELSLTFKLNCEDCYNFNIYFSLTESLDLDSSKELGRKFVKSKVPEAISDIRRCRNCSSENLNKEFDYEIKGSLNER